MTQRTLSHAVRTVSSRRSSTLRPTGYSARCFAALVVGLLLPIKITKAQSCADTTTVTARDLLPIARRLASSADQQWSTYRASVMNIATQVAESVVFVTNDATCQLAKAAYQNAVQQAVPHPVRVLVFAMGVDYLVVDPDETFGGRSIGHVFGPTWQRKSVKEIGL